MNHEAMETKICITCLGNEIASDDGIGIRVGRILSSLDLPGHIEVRLQRTIGLELLDDLRKLDLLLIVDAMRVSFVPGTIRVFDISETAEMAHTPYCCHSMGLAEVLSIAEKMESGPLPRRVVVVGIEAAVLDTFGTELSIPVREVLPDALEKVLDLCHLPEDVQREGRRKARQQQDFTPTLKDVLG